MDRTERLFLGALIILLLMICMGAKERRELAELEAVEHEVDLMYDVSVKGD